MNTTDQPSPERAGQPRQLHTERVRSIAQEAASAANIPGISIAVATPDEVRYAGAVGYADLARRPPLDARCRNAYRTWCSTRWA
ncbi:beta-lactamase family protein [Pseudarthrobacter sp. R1]|uniref:beta-lactamase family protein n=1 Tax=Pseudarthrobacter sp. R1 TaxID=2944934 RepID=UPI002109E5F7|nr:beta-lactamase family protein [Pseudarthrobacter sp. R1]MCQ6270848.1 beta-lactamase family protein [Pseudarthrobacter sp. R1]